ncbi:MAG: glycosyltransferase family 2 protein [Flavobacteriales bacterium]|nr:glycosyltransferase family 2 protein [Flavobacteriales bacterium]
MKISVVSPVYLGEKLVQELVQRITTSVSSLTNDFEIILVEDGSKDNSWDEIQAACQQNAKVKGVKLSRNFGQHYAITAGLSLAKGDWIVVLDCDLQDQPEEIPRLFKKAEEGFDIVFARRVNRQDGFLKKLSSKLFYSLFGYLTDSEQDETIANFGIYHQKVITAILSMKDHVRYFPTMVQWVGFSKTKIDVEHSNSPDNESSYSWGSLITLAVNNIIAFSDKPLRLTMQLGFSISFIAFLTGLYYLYLYAMGKIVVLGFASLVISIWFLAGLIIFILGIMGIYIGKTFDRVKDRPTFIIDQKINLDE